MSRRGLSLLEVLIAVTVLSSLVVGYLTFSHYALKTAMRTSELSGLALLLSFVEKDVMKDMPFIPPQTEDDGVIDSPMFRQPTDGTPPVSGERCYDRMGAVIGSCDDFDTDRTIGYRTQFFKVRVRDQSLSADSLLNRIPISRVRFKVFYKLENAIQEPFYFSRLYTELIRY